VRPAAVPLSPLAERIEKIMADNGWTQRDLAARAGLTQAAISRFFTDPKRRGNSATIEKIAAAAGVSVSWLTSGDEGPAAPGPRDPYPHREQALRGARTLGYFEEQDMQALRNIAGFHSDDDPKVEWWMDRLRRIRDRRIGAAPQREGEVLKASPPPRADRARDDEDP
jgi:transcriptional regulator with XRE-family HTH domain